MTQDRLSIALQRAKETIDRVDRRQNDPIERAKSIARRREERMAEIMRPKAEPAPPRAAPAPTPHLRSTAPPQPLSKKPFARLADAVAGTTARAIVDIKREQEIQSAKCEAAIAKVDAALARAEAGLKNLGGS